MNRRACRGAALVLTGLLASTCAGEAAAQGAVPSRAVRTSGWETLSGFVANHGQWDAEVLFFARGNGVEATLTREAIVLQPLPPRDLDEPAASPIVMRLPGPAPLVEGEGVLPTAHHFILGTGKASDVPGYVQVIYRDVAPGIDMVVRRGAEGFAYDLHVEAGVSVSDLVDTPTGPIEQRMGDSWQPGAGGSRESVVSRFTMLGTESGRSRFGFEVSGRDIDRPLVIDPTFVWGTYLGGPSQEAVRDLHVAADGTTYVAMKTWGEGPTTPGAFLTDKPDGSNAWIGRLSPDGTTLEWGTYLGGSETENILGVEVDQDGTVVVVGDTWSADFPTTAGSVQPVFAGANDMFVSRLEADGSNLVWSTFYGGDDNDHAYSLALFSSGEVLIAGDSDTPEPPATPGAYDTVFDAGDRMIVRFAADGASVVFQTYIFAGIRRMTVVDDAHIYFAGNAVEGSPVTPGALKTSMAAGDPVDGYVAMMDAMGTSLEWATFIGGDDNDFVNGFVVDAAGAIYVTGPTQSDNFPVTAGAFDVTYGAGGGDTFVAKILPGGTGLCWATYIAACCGGGTTMWDMALNTAGNAIVVGSSNEPNFPTTPDAFQPMYIGSFPFGDFHLTEFDAFGEALVYSTYYGGSSGDTIEAYIGLDAEQDAYVALKSSSHDIPVSPGAFDSTHGGSTDTVVAKFDLDLLPWEVLGGGMKGTDHIPNLAGTGELTAGAPGRLSVRGALPSSVSFLVAGLTAIHHPLEGGILVPDPAIVLVLSTDTEGGLDVPFTWPTGVPAEIDVWIQMWIPDAGGPFGYAATNALKMTSQ